MTKELDDNLIVVFGNFNVVHPGHARLFSFAKGHNGKLIVAVFSDKIAGEDALIDEQLRLENVKNNSLVDEAVICDEASTSFLKRVRPRLVIKGSEFANQHNPEKEVLEDFGGQLLFYSGVTNISSIDLIRNEFNFEYKTKIEIPQGYLSRHNTTEKKLKGIVSNFADLHVCVIGDLIIDEYISCEPIGMSQEDPLVVFAPVENRKFVGGAGIVALHASGLGAKTTFLTVTGLDANRKFAIDTFKKTKINVRMLNERNRNTNHKTRFRSRGKTVFRTNILDDHPITESTQTQIVQEFDKIASTVDVLVFSDFNYGSIPIALARKLMDIAKRNNVFISADSQSSSQLGNLAKFSGSNLLTPTEREARLYTGSLDSGLASLAQKVIEQSEADYAILTLGQDGIIIYKEKDSQNSIFTDRISALNKDPKDVAGAGDSLLVSTALALSAGASIWESALIGSIAASIQVSRVGNTPIQSKELLDAF